MDESQRREYWRTNITLVAVLLSVWALVSFGFSILLVEPLNAIVINDFPLGFWFAQNGSIFVFITLIGIYVWRMDRLDDQYGVGERNGNRMQARPAGRTDAAEPADGQTRREQGP